MSLINDQFLTTQVANSSTSSWIGSPAGTRQTNGGCDINSLTLEFTAQFGYVRYTPTSSLNLSNTTVQLTGSTNSLLSAGVTLGLTDSNGHGLSVNGSVVGSTVSWNTNDSVWQQFVSIDMATIVDVLVQSQVTDTGSFTSFVSSVACILEGSTVLVVKCGSEEYVPIENISVGDVIKTRDGTSIARKINRIEVSDDDHVPYIVPAHSISLDVPFTDTYLSPNHAIVVRNEWVHVNHSEFQRRYTDVKRPIVYYHITTNDYMKDVIYVNGMESETCDVEEMVNGWNCDTIGHICKRLDKHT